MMKKFSYSFEIIYKKYLSLAESRGAPKKELSINSLMRFLGVSSGKLFSWKKGQWPLAADIETIAERLGLSYRWLVTGEGDPEGEDAPPVAKLRAASPVPVIGLAACGLDGIEQIMPHAVTASLPSLGPRAVAVVASGESMAPAGIASGHVCFCDPDQDPLPGEAVFFRRRDDKGALKLFLGAGKREGYTTFKGWLPADDKGRRREVVIDVLDEQIDYIAPVIMVRRRL